MVAVGVLGVTIVSLYAGFTSGFAVVRVARENLRATQVLSERMELIRLVKWDNVTPGFIPTSFTAPFSVSDPNSSAPSDFTYQGTVTITNPPDMSESYATNLRMIQIDLTWTSGRMTRKRQMTTYVSRYGMQNYIY
jgi:type II secretory pathway pseudopilin PulG